SGTTTTTGEYPLDVYAWRIISVNKSDGTHHHTVLPVGLFAGSVAMASCLGQPLTHVDIDEIDRIQQEEQSAGHSHTTTGLLLTSKQRQTINASRPWEQVVTDDQGRRRFHGAFTGGFSAGYYNTVGTEEGWTPSTFVSSRRSRKNDKQDEEEGGHDGMKQQRHQRISDFMDEEDYNDGIGADDVAAVGGSSSSGGFAWRRESGEVEVKERVGLAIMRSQGWREGMLVGEVSKLRHHRQSPDVAMNSEPSPPQANDRKRKVYTVSSLPPQLRAARRATGNTTGDYDDDEKEEVEEEREHRNIVAVHRSVDRILHNHKDDMHGIGYSGTLRAGNTAGGPSTTGANELLSSIFGPDGESRGTRQQQQHGSSNRQQQQQKRSSSTQAVGAFGI
ncbi:G patch domain-containing protein 1, partial [Perkinsus olseni]